MSCVARKYLYDRMVDLAPLREAVLREIGLGYTWGELCLRLGWIRPNGTADTSRLQRAVGVRPGQSRGKRYITRRIRYDNAVELVRGLGFDPVDFGV